jgi:putative autotransporter adhesin-like protein
MQISSEHRSLLLPRAGAVEALPARVTTSRALGFPCSRIAGATPVPRSTRRLAIALALLACGLAACEPFVQGNGVFREERRADPGPFTGIHVESGVEATVTAGVADRSVTVSGDANVVPYIQTEVRTDSGRQVLHVWISKAFVGTIPPRAIVEVPALEFALATQSSRVNGKSLAASSFEVVADQGGNVVLEGAALPAGDSIDVRLATGAILNATAYGVSEGASVQLSGGSVARLRCDGPVSGNVTGGSQLENLQGSGSCAAVVVDGNSTLSCH